MGTGETAPMRQSRSTDQMSTSGASSQQLPIQVNNLLIQTQIVPGPPLMEMCYLSEYGLCSVSLENMLYLVGGQTTVADCYNTASDEWRTISVMKERRMECGAVVINGCIYVTGGYSYSKGTYLQSIEKYDPQLDSWEIVGTLPSPSRSHGCVCVLSV